METEIATLRQYVAKRSSPQGSHGMDHVLRVADLCEQIGRVEQADMEVLLPAALFHDIGRKAESEQGIPHEIAGAQIAEEYFRAAGFERDRIRRITDAIRTHRYRSQEKPATLEAQILSDADKLDAMGAVGIARTFLSAGEHEGGIDSAVVHIREKLLNLEDGMYTATARMQARNRHRFLCTFLEALRSENAIADFSRSR